MSVAGTSPPPAGNDAAPFDAASSGAASPPGHRDGHVRLRAAETILPVAFGDAEAECVERAARSTVRELEAAVRRERGAGADDEEEWVALRTHLPPDERAVGDAAIDLAGELMPASSRMERLEAIAQETLCELLGDPDADETAPLDPAFRRLGPREAVRRAELEKATERWSMLPSVIEIAVPDVQFPHAASAAEVDATLRELARLRSGWDQIIGYCALAVRKRRMHALLGFASFRQYVEERLDCQVPGCSHRGTHSHHLAFRSQGGGDELANQVALCPFHHLRCVHGGYLRVFGRAPDALTWFLGGKPWRGPRMEAAARA